MAMKAILYMDGHEPQVMENLGQCVIVGLPADTSKPEQSQMFAATTNKGLAEIGLFLIRIAKRREKGERMDDVILGDHKNLAADMQKDRIILPPHMRGKHFKRQH